jgi:predicted ATP-dependent serine protease
MVTKKSADKDVETLNISTTFTKVGRIINKLAVILTGDAGVGKSNFLIRLAFLLYTV